MKIITNLQHVKRVTDFIKNAIHAYEGTSFNNESTYILNTKEKKKHFFC